MRPRPPLRLRWLLALAALLLSSLAMFSTTVTLGREQERQGRAIEAQGLLRLARLDLAEGSLRLLARGMAEADWNEGLALLREAGDGFREAVERASPDLLPAAESGALLQDLEASLDALAAGFGRFAAAGGAGKGPGATEPELWIGLRDIERGAGSLDALLTTAREKVGRDSTLGYLLALWAASLLLAGTALAFHFAAAAEARADRALAESRLLLDALVELSPSRIYAHDRQGRCILANGTQAALYGLSEGDILGRSRSSYLGAEEAAAQTAKDSEIFAFGRERSDEEFVDGPAGRRWFLTTRFPLRGPEGAVYAVGGISTEVTERREAAERLGKAYAEKVALIDEINHRARNNMQVISSWLYLQGERSEEASVKAVLKDAESRIGAMALVHGMLYRGGDLSYLELADYLRELVELLLRRDGDVGGGLSAELSLEPVRSAFDAALSCGLVVTELFTNSLRHAFKGGPGQVRLSLGRDEGGRIELRYADDGPGLPVGFSPREQGGLGLMSVIASVENQLGGEIAFGEGPGFSCTLRFGDDSYAARV